MTEVFTAKITIYADASKHREETARVVRAADYDALTVELADARDEVRQLQSKLDDAAKAYTNATRSLAAKDAELVSPEAIDAAARHLRETLQAGKRLTPWETTPRATKKKWLALAEGTLLSARRAREAQGGE